MRISAKGRYALAAMTYLAQSYPAGEHITLASIADGLGISKIYLEQVFALLKKGGLVSSIKGAQGGYQLTRNPKEISTYEVLSEVESYIFDKAEDTVSDKAPAIESALRIMVLDRIDDLLLSELSEISLCDLVDEAQKHRGNDELMFYI